MVVEIKMLPVGPGAAANAISATLVSGSPLRAVGSLWAIASLVVVPLTIIQQSYSFSVGYGFSVAAMVCYLFDAYIFFIVHKYISWLNARNNSLSNLFFFTGIGSFEIVCGKWY